ncbi:glycerophosphodiester phosphodiesterase [Clostridium bowmanii]|uniref:glycerophosphodiester phosphodiesterase n=1 Tax=Clostridium bowmanii TaxID=132925 RepID=UPI001C0BF595|nr:glycerophosphodiester phosphodiesterase [Clostridium bowmanii]MBU3188027.1 glycerophosphodiester phosphodiesterase [Clostridium bowmanii]MCA1072206.1 glycerophosphodiester phosphodiesterase [Clostridium bowmanii]
MTINFAHRGASAYYPENTMLSFEKALEMGATGIETDVQLTKDGVLVLIHDEMVNRTTDGVGLVKDYTYKELSKLDAGSWMGEEFAGAKIPTVEELIYFTLDSDIIINFEIKNGIVMYEDIEQKLIDLIYKHKINRRVILSSFNHYSIAKCNKISKGINTGVLYMEGIYKPYNYAKTVGARAIHPYVLAINEEVIKETKKHKTQINVFTVDEEQKMKFLLDMKVDGIITNCPDKLHKIMTDNNEETGL